MMKDIETYLQDQKIDVMGVADVRDWPSALSECRPSEILTDCKRVIVFGKEIPGPVYVAEKHAYDLYANVAHNYYASMDAAAIEVCSMLTREGFPSIPLGCYQPMLMREGKYWGVVSLKHAAVRAGIGTMGKNTLLANAKFGNRLRLGGLLTTAELPSGKPLEKSLCIEGCNKCVEACPVQALDGSGGIVQYKCLKQSTVHPLLSAAFLSQWLRGSKFVNENFEVITATLAARYSYSCYECLVNCPNFKLGLAKRAS